MKSHVKTMIPAICLFMVSACSAPAEQESQPPKPDPLAQLDASVVEEIAGNSGHNLLARSDRLERGMALANAVKGVTGKKYCSPERTLYLGKRKLESYWTIECHDGSSYQVQIKRDGSGAVMDCADPKALGIDVNCWKPFEDSSKQSK